MKLSIIIPIYNVQDYIVRCMEGVLHQDLEDYEVIAVDDGSPDRSVELLQEYLATHPEEAARVRLIRKENGGLSDARNAGITAAKGEYLWFVDSDDTIEENCLGALYDAALRDDLDLMMFDERNIEYRDEQEIEHSEEYRKGRIKESVQSGIDLFVELRSKRLYYGCAQGYWIRRETLLTNNLWFLKSIHHEDELFTPQALHYARRARYIAAHPYHRYIRMGSITSGENIEQLVHGYAAVVTGLLGFADQEVRFEQERHYLYEDVVDLSRILIGESSKHRDLSQQSLDAITLVKRQLRDHGLHLGIPFQLYVMKNRCKNRVK